MKKIIRNSLIFIAILSSIPIITKFIIIPQVVAQNLPRSQYKDLDNQIDNVPLDDNISIETKVFQTPFWKFEIGIPSDFELTSTGEIFIANYEKENTLFQIRNIDTYEIMKDFYPDIKRSQLNYTNWDSKNMEITLDEFSKNYFDSLIAIYPGLIIDKKEIVSIGSNTCLQLTYHYDIPDSENNEVFYSEAYVFMINGCNVSLNIQFTDKETVKLIRDCIYSITFMKTRNTG